MLLKERHKDILMQIFSQIPFSLEVWAYGSRVNGDAHEGSDLDLVIRTLNNEYFPNQFYHQLKENITESNIPFLVDLFLWHQLPKSFQRNIEEKHEVLFSNF